MSDRQRLPIDLHAAVGVKAKALRSRTYSSPRAWAVLCAALLVLVLTLEASPQARAAQPFQISVAVETGNASRTDMPIDAPLDLTNFLSAIAGTLDPASIRVLEIAAAKAVVDSNVLFQFDTVAGFDPTTNAAGNLVFVMAGTTPAQSTRWYRVLFDVVGGGDYPAPPAVPVPTTVDSLMYENQMTYLIATPRADYYYHQTGAGLASIIDADGNDWISFHDIAGSGETGIYRGMPNLVYTPGNPAASYFHPGFTNATSTLVSHGPLKVTMRSITNDPANEWIVAWEFYQNFARLTVEQVGTSNDGSYWFLYEGTPGGSLDVGDVVVRSDGTTTSATNTSDRWEEPLFDPQWLYFHDTAAARYLFVCDDFGDDATDSYRYMGDAGGATPGMTVFGLGRSLSSVVPPGLSGTGRTFTVGLGEDNTMATAEINGAYLPLVVTLGQPVGRTSHVDDGLPRDRTLHQNYPNPFNPATTIGFDLPARGTVDLSVYDTAGRRVRTLVSENLAAGSHAFVWDGRDQSGRMAASGIYLYRLVTPEEVLHGKMTLIE